MRPFCSGGGNGDAPCPDDDVADGDLGVPETQAGEIKDAQLIFGIVWYATAWADVATPRDDNEWLCA